VLIIAIPRSFMKTTATQLIARYRKALRAELDGVNPPTAESVTRLGLSMANAGIKGGELLDAHLNCMIEGVRPGRPSGSRKVRCRDGGFFLARVLECLGGTADKRRIRILQDLCRKTLDFGVKNTALQAEIDRKRESETSRSEREARLNSSLKQARSQLDQIRAFSRQNLISQEEERRKISRDLHDVIAQNLTAINIRLVALRKEAGLNTKNLAAKIAVAQRLLASSTRIVHQFARELRPAELEDIGLIPALEGALKSFLGRTGIRVDFESFPGVETLNTFRRTTLFRVAQEAFSNTARHAEASELKVVLRKKGRMVIMEIADNGKSFNPDEIPRSSPGRGLGLLGMRERLEIAGGKLEILASPGKGTRIIATIPAKDSDL
jgi:signal transduction histidine kinase